MVVFIFGKKLWEVNGYFFECDYLQMLFLCRWENYVDGVVTKEYVKSTRQED